jgi:hypothetical protein
MCVYFLIPCLTMSISFFIIYTQVKKSNLKYARFLAQKKYKSNARIYLKKIRLNKQMLLRLSLVNAYFFASIMPHFVFNIFLRGGDEHFSASTNYLIKTFVEILFFSINALNFFFHGISSEKFRQELVRIVKRQPKRAKNWKINWEIINWLFEIIILFLRNVLKLLFYSKSTQKVFEIIKKINKSLFLISMTKVLIIFSSS